jgi:hypothetical protein
MQDKQIKKDLKQLDKMLDRVVEWNKEFDMGKLIEQISQQRIKLIEQIGKQK